MNGLSHDLLPLITIALWVASYVAWQWWPGSSKGPSVARLLILAGLLVLSVMMIRIWMDIHRPPMRTLGETRLWYALFLGWIGWITWYRWNYQWLLIYSLGMASLFLALNLFMPETYSHTLMPALMSPWFIPHVIVYLFAYALLAMAAIVAIIRLLAPKRTSPTPMSVADHLVRIGFAFLTLGLLFGALWAKEAWGHYWTWDPKETWAFLTWITYLVYIHWRYHYPDKSNAAALILVMALVILIICWFGVQYLPSASNSVHIYSR